MEKSELIACRLRLSSVGKGLNHTTIRTRIKKNLIKLDRENRKNLFLKLTFQIAEKIKLKTNYNEKLRKRSKFQTEETK